jgi:protein-S-isoprenylcysteine O-methyltransferase Ste14
MWHDLQLKIIIRWVAVLFVLVWGGIEIFQQIKQCQQSQGQTNYDKGSLMLLYAAIAVGYGIGIAFAFTSHGRVRWGRPYLALFGLSVIFAGAWIRFSAMQILGRHFSYAVSIHEQHELIEKGLYRYIRHPAYLGILLISLGMGLAFANWISLVSLSVFPFIAFGLRMDVEEKAMLGYFGARYVEYRKRTWRLIPWLY